MGKDKQQRDAYFWVGTALWWLLAALVAFGALRVISAFMSESGGV